MSHNDNAGWSRPSIRGGGVSGNGIESAAPSSSPWTSASPSSSFGPSAVGPPGGGVWRPDAAVRVAAHGLH